jgi:hypothetical protein
MKGAGVQFVICSREQAKLGYRWKPAAVLRPARDGAGGLMRDDHGDVVRLLCCPSCFTTLTDDEGVPLGWNDLRTKRLRCESCGGPLWEADRTGPRRVPLADYIRRQMAGYFDLFLGDEMHECAPRGATN